MCAAASEYFVEPVKREHVVWTYSGVRPLYDDGASKAQEATRDYVLKADAPEGHAPLLNIFGGKITTYRRLSEHMLEKIEDQLGKRGNPWTAGGVLPGGDFAATAFDAELLQAEGGLSVPGWTHMHAACSGFTARKRVFCLAARLPSRILANISDLIFTRRKFGYLIGHEWAVTAQDVLWRRTKKGLHLSAEEAVALDRFMESAVDRRRKLAAE